MSCKQCAERRRLAREALLNAKTKKAVGHIVKGVAEFTGLRPKTAIQESELEESAEKPDTTEAEFKQPNTGQKAKRK